jgi:hypothetical protein
MTAELAAVYCGEPSVEAFLVKVPKVYPEAIRTPGVLPKWHRRKLDQAIDRRHGLCPDGPLVDLEALSDRATRRDKAENSKRCG